MLSEDDVRTALGARLRAARSGPKVRAEASGVGQCVIARLEGGLNRQVDLLPVYLLARHYGCSLAALLDLSDDLGRWPRHAPSLPETDAAIRAHARRARLEFGFGTPHMSRLLGCQQTWVVRFEGGGKGAARTDVVRVIRWALALDLRASDFLPTQFTEPS